MASTMTGSRHFVAGPWRSYGPGGYRPHRDPRVRSPWRRGLPAPYMLPAGLHGRLDAAGVLICCAVVVGALAPVSEPTAAAPLAVIGWLTVVGFSRPPYADLRLTGAVASEAAITLAATALATAIAGAVVRQWSARVKLESVDRRRESGIDLRRQLAGGAIAAVGLPALTALLSAFGSRLCLSDDPLV